MAPTKKTKAQKDFERRRAEIAQILLDRGEQIPLIPMTPAWVQNWDAREARIAHATQAVHQRGETLPPGGITDSWLQAWEANEARLASEAQAAEDERLQREAEARAAAKKAAAAKKDATAKERASPEGKKAFAAAKLKARVEADTPRAAVLRRLVMKLTGIEVLCNTDDAFDTDFDGEDGSDDEMELSLDEQELERQWAEDSAPEPMQSNAVDELDPPQKRRKIEEAVVAKEHSPSQDGKLSVKKPAPVLTAKMKGFRKSGNLRKALSDKKKEAANMPVAAESAIFEETGVGLEDEDQVLDAKDKKATVQNLPPKFRMDSDPRLGSPNVSASLLVDEAERHERFCENARKILRFLKSVATDYMKLSRDAKRTAWCPMVRGLLALLHHSSEDYLLESLLSGIDDSVRSVLGKPGFTIEDLLSIPRLSVDQNLEKGVYLDVLTIIRGADKFRQLYVGAAGGKFGLAQRWHQYLNRKCKRESGKHSVKVMESTSRVQLRALAHYGQNPIPWLTCLAESFFMLYLGTISDPCTRYDDGDVRATYVHDDLYKTVEQCRKFAGLADRLGVGLNSTWSLSQGYRWVEIHGHKGCYNCKRPWVPQSDPSWEPQTFQSCDATRPGERVVCINCADYRGRHGRDRPLRAETVLQFRKQVPVPDVCEHKDCDRELMQHEETEGLALACKELGIRLVVQSPATSKWIPYVFQHDKVLFGTCMWVCPICINKNRWLE